jgi:hypothetical protein
MADNEDELVDYDEEEVRHFPSLRYKQRILPIEKTTIWLFGRISTYFLRNGRLILTSSFDRPTTGGSQRCRR